METKEIRKKFQLCTFLSGLALIVTINFGCTAVQTFPLAARAGDTITVTVGSPDGMNATNTSVQYTPDTGPGAGTPVPLTISSMFNIYPDKTSAAWLNTRFGVVATNAITIENTTGHGPWTKILAIDLPGSLTAGTGVLEVNTSAAYSTLTTHINDINIALEILPNTGTKHPFEFVLQTGINDFGDLAELEPLRRFVVKPNFTGAGTATYGAIEIVVNVPSLDLLDTDDVKVIADEKIGSVFTRQSHYTWSASGNDIKVMFISPKGLLKYYDAHFSVLSNNIWLLLDNSLITIGDITTTATYYDINGDIAAGPALSIIDET